MCFSCWAIIRPHEPESIAARSSRDSEYRESERKVDSAQVEPAFRLQYAEEDTVESGRDGGGVCTGGGVGLKEPLRLSDEVNERQEGSDRVRQVLDGQAGIFEQSFHLARDIPSLMHQGNIVPTPQGLIGWNRREQDTSGGENPCDLARCGTMIRDMFEDVEGDSGIEGRIGEGQRRRRSLHQGGPAAFPAVFESKGLEIKPDNGAKGPHPVHGAARSATDIENSGRRPVHKQSAKRPKQQTTPCDKPPMSVFQTKHPRVFLAVHANTRVFCVAGKHRG